MVDERSSDATVQHGDAPHCCAPTDRSELTNGAEGATASGAAGSVPAASGHEGPAVRTGSVPERHVVPQAHVPAQTFAMGDARGDGAWDDGETPVHLVALSEFDIDTTSVTNDDFARFVAATGYRTEAETFGYSAVFHLALAAADEDVLGQPPQTPWWLGVRGADWRHPGGSRSSIEGLGDHPVVHVSWNDAVAYCAWAGRALPTEAQWEAASRGGLDGARYPWGDDLGARESDSRAVSAGSWRANIWQGAFPTTNTLADGYLTTAPVHTFAPNAYGLWQTVGNVWEWCADAWAVDTYARDAEAAEQGDGSVHDPVGPAVSTADVARVMRGGSFLCHDSYCNRYRNAARSSNTPDSSMANAGFRTVSRA